MQVQERYEHQALLARRSQRMAHLRLILQAFRIHEAGSESHFKMDKTKLFPDRESVSI